MVSFFFCKFSIVWYTICIRVNLAQALIKFIYLIKKIKNIVSLFCNIEYLISFKQLFRMNSKEKLHGICAFEKILCSTTQEKRERGRFNAQPGVQITLLPVLKNMPNIFLVIGNKSWGI